MTCAQKTFLEHVHLNEFMDTFSNWLNILQHTVRKIKNARPQKSYFEMTSSHSIFEFELKKWKILKEHLKVYRDEIFDFFPSEFSLKFIVL
jgi:hypothetical protein